MNKLHYFIFLFFLILILISCEQKIEGPGVLLYASSSFVEKDNPYAYDPCKVMDNDPETAWNEGAEGAGIGEELSLYFENAISFNRIVILPGFFDTIEYALNNRIKQLEISIIQKNYSKVTRLFELTDGMTEKTLDFPDTIEANAVHFIIRDVYPGSSCNETFISEISFFLNNQKYENKTNINAEFLKKIEKMMIENYAKCGNKIAGKMAGPNNTMLPGNIEYFFPDGTYIEKNTIFQSFYMAAGRWELSSDCTVLSRSTDIEIKLHGIGKSCQTYYPDYEIIRNTLNKKNKVSLEELFSDPYLNISVIPVENYSILFENIDKELMETIKGLQARYKKAVDAD